MPQFPHLPLRNIVSGAYRSRGGGGGRPSLTTQTNLQDRVRHGNALLSELNNLSSNWEQILQSREDQARPLLPDSDIVPLFLQVDPNTFDIESLKGFGIEIISEEEGGFIIGAASIEFATLRQKIDRFINAENRSNKAAELWTINEGSGWRIEQILSDELQAKWDEIADDIDYIVDVGIACYVKIPDQPLRDDGEDEEHYQQRYNGWEARVRRIQEQRDNVARDRESKFESLVSAYGGELLSGYLDFEDSFSCRVKISGRGLKDIVLTYQFLFEVIEYDPYTLPETQEGDPIEIAPVLIAPDLDAPLVCVIDSGIQEQHRLLSAAIDSATSTSFIPGDNSTADSVRNGGHGTRVAGAILFPNSIPRTGEYSLVCRLQNARILGGDRGILPATIFPPTLMEEICDQFPETKIFNLSINSQRACRLTHMSQWAAAIDRLMYERNVLFIISAGNLFKSSGSNLNPGVYEHLNAGRDYPAFLRERASRIANPAQSSFALSVGSVCKAKFENDLKESFGGEDDPSSFSRTGFGLWGMIKPDVCQYGGDLAKEKNANPIISYESAACPELVRSTLDGGGAVGRDIVGTSFAAPKVAHIAAHLQKIFPEHDVNLYRALIVQSARLPNALLRDPTAEAMRSYGYGIPELQRAIDNSSNRVTMVNSGNVSPRNANIYTVLIPEGLRSPAEDYDVLIEVTLSFMAKPRRTRRRTQSYLSSWLDWQSSKLNESYEQFASRVVQNIEVEPAMREANDQDSIKWVIRENRDWSVVEGIRRQDSTVQKSWCVLKSYQLPRQLCIAVIGHKGWSKDLGEQIPISIAVSIETLDVDVNVYESIRVENEVEIEIRP